MEKEKKVKTENRSGKRLYLLLGSAVFAATFIVALLSHLINASRIDRYYREMSLYTAQYAATMVDVQQMKTFKEVIKTDEFQEVREKAEKENYEQPVEAYLKTQGVWNDYFNMRKKISHYLRAMEQVEYLYIVDGGGKDDKDYMYLIDDDTNPVYMVGHSEEKEKEFIGVDFSKEIQPTISRGEWGWLCSAYVPVYDQDGNTVCQVGCDVSMTDVMKERIRDFVIILVSSILIAVLVTVGLMFSIRKRIISPLNSIKQELEKFSPAEGLTPEASGVLDLDIGSNDEVKDLYDMIRSMQLRILDELGNTGKKNNEKKNEKSKNT